MILEDLLKNKDNLRSWIEDKADSDIKYITLERQIFAFYLLEKLVETGVEFVFKGGTSLILLLENTNRFSTDIDILITWPNLEEIVSLFSKFVRFDSIFARFEEDIREDSKFPKKHYKFYFSSLYKNEDQDGYILLDMVFQSNPYENLIEKPIKSDVLLTSDPYDNVLMPSLTDIMIDKLTAFAPRTIGVKFFRKFDDEEYKDFTREVVKQWFDINEIFKKCENFTNLNNRYIKFSDFEIEQRELLDKNYLDCLTDTFECALEYLNESSKNKELISNLKKGIRRLNAFVNIDITSNYFIEASVNVIELISRVLCDEVDAYNKYVEESKEKFPYEQFIKDKGVKLAVQKVFVNNKEDRERFVKSLRVIDIFLRF
jgi:hypothetical protein